MFTRLNCELLIHFFQARLNQPQCLAHLQHQSSIKHILTRCAQVNRPRCASSGPYSPGELPNQRNGNVSGSLASQIKAAVHKMAAMKRLAPAAPDPDRHSPHCFRMQH